MTGSKHPRVVIRTLATGHSLIAGVLWAMVFILFGILEVLMAKFGDLEHSVWQLGAVTAAKYGPLSIGVMLVPLWLRIFVANGVTRRDFCLGAVLFTALYAGAFAVVLALGTGVESLILSKSDPGLASAMAPRLYDTVGQVPAAFLCYVVALAAYACSGLLIGAGFQRFGAWLGTVLAIPALLPVVVCEGLLPSGLVEGNGVLGLPPVVGGLLSLVVTGAAGVVFFAVVRGATVGAAPIRR